MQALGKHVAAKAIFEEKKTTILLHKEPKPIYYEIVSVGKDVSELSVGDLIYPPDYISKYIQDEDLYIFNCENVYAKK
jgi:hypothetical protein